MKNTFGNNLTITIFGESHGSAIGCVLDGLPSGLSVCDDVIKEALSRRRPSLATDTPRIEPDNYNIVSGTFNGKTTGTPLAIFIPNENTNSSDYEYGPARPSHADYAAHVKYHGFEDYRGGGHFSGRVTAALVAASAVLTPSLKKLGIEVGTHLLSCGNVCDRAFEDVAKDLAILKGKMFPVLNSEKEEEMIAEILSARKEGDSVGGVTETAIIGLPAGLGEPWFDSVESTLSHILFSIGAIKGVEFGDGFSMAKMRGSEANDAFYIDKNGKALTKTNRSGGINGGITNGMPIVFKCAVKPTPSISIEQDTVNFVTNEEIKLSIKGRHDPGIVRRVCPVVDAAATIAIADIMLGRYGEEAFRE